VMGDGDVGSMSVADASSQVRAFLAERDTPCPACGYNLRGLAGTKCPECGRMLLLKELMGPTRGRLGRWFWGGIAIDAGLIVWMSLGLARTMPAADAAKRVVLGIALSAALTSIFMLLVYFRRDRVDPETLASEMAWAIWVPLMIKLTCLGGMLFGGP
jgi:hypothetical protein